MTLTRQEALDIVPDGRLFIDGGWLESSSGGTRTHHDPSTGAPAGDHQMAGPFEVDLAVRAARGAFERGELEDRIRRRFMLWSLADAVEAAADELAALQSLEMGQPVRAARAGVALAAEWLRYFGGWADKLEGAVVPAGPGVLDYVLAVPYGVIGAITPWNGPVISLGLKLAPALAAGNTVVVKPSEMAPFSALRFAGLCESVLPPGVINLVIGGPEAGGALCSHPGIDKITFTGGGTAARAVARAAAENHTPILLELGGKSASVVFADVEPSVIGKLAARLGTIQNSGQGCFLPTRLLVDRAVYGDVADSVVAGAESATLGDPFNSSTTMGPVAGEATRQRIESFIESSRLRGDGRLLTGGHRPDGPLSGGAFVRPTVFGEVDAVSPLAQEEIFGPVLALIPFEDEEEALAIANGTRYGLAGYVWTNDLRRAHRVAEALDAGYVSVNGMAGLPPSAPFGGWGSSGHGVEGGRWGIHEFIRMKNVHVALR